MVLRIIEAARRKLPFVNDPMPSKAKIYRERGGTPVLEECGAVRVTYDELPDMHKLETGEETKAVNLEAIIQAYESNDPDHATYLVDVEDKTLICRGVYEQDQIKEMNTYAGEPALHFYEAESGQLVNWKPEFQNTRDVTGDIHEQAAQAWEKYDKGNKDEEPDMPRPRNLGVTPYLIDDRDERLTAWMDHLKIRFEKYQGGEGFWSEHFELAIVLAVGFSIAVIYYAALGEIGQLIPIAQDIAGTLPGLEEAASGIAEQGSGGGTPGR
jgi:hypothetical protein